MKKYLWLAFYAFFSLKVYALSDLSVIGNFESEIVSSSVAYPGETQFYNEAGRIKGFYYFEENGRRIEGVLTSCHRAVNPVSVTCSWSDQYGQGLVDFTFTSDFQSFKGFWRAKGVSHTKYPWNGSRND